MRSKSFKGESVGYLYVLPASIFMIAFIGYPIINNLLLSFQDINVMTFNDKVKEFIGFGNYIELFKSSLFQQAVSHTFFYTVACIILQFSIGLALAVFFNKKFQLAKSIRGLVMVAWLIPVTITGMLFKFMFSTNGGIINQFLLSAHLISKPVEWLMMPDSAMWVLIIANTWIGIPFNMILLVTGLSTIPVEVYESASIDGTNRWQRFIYITIPLLKSSIEAVLILGFIYTFKVFDLVYVMTKGGPVNATEVLSTVSYRMSFNEFSFSKGAAVANLLFMVLFVISLGYLKLVRDEEAQ